MFRLFAQGDATDIACDGLSATGAGCSGGEETVNNVVGGIVNILLFVVGVGAVIMLIIGGLRYVTSGGDAQAATSAKNTIIYSIIGLILAVAAYAIANFVMDI